jgi:hypothetical protein
VSSKPEFDRHKFGSSDELRAKGLEQIGGAAALLKSKATPEEVDAYRGFVLTAAAKVAAAHKEEGIEVSPGEQTALDEIRGRLEA